MLFGGIMKRERRMRLRTLLLLLLIYGPVTVSMASQYYVDTARPDDNGNGKSWLTAKKTIQAAINIADDYDIITVAPGVYTGSSNSDLDPLGLSLTIRSTNPDDWDIVSQTIIDPNATKSEPHRGFYIFRGEDPNCVISGFTIRNGYSGGQGGAIYCLDSNPTIKNCLIYQNNAETYGGGIFCYWSDPLIFNCVLRNNSAGLNGGGIEAWYANPTVKNCLLIDNHADSGKGGGFDCYNSPLVHLINCTLVRNTAAVGGAFNSWSSNGIIKNSILWDNLADPGPEVALNTSSVHISYSDVQGGFSAVHDLTNGLVWSRGNINIDPNFASFDPTTDSDTWDMRLRSQAGRWDEAAKQWVMDSVTSPCIDAGDPNSLWHREPWPHGKHINMGAYGNTAQAGKNGNLSDFNLDGKVDLDDFSIIADKWGSSSSSDVDLNNNGNIGAEDLILFIPNWLWHKE